MPVSQVPHASRASTPLSRAHRSSRAAAHGMAMALILVLAACGKSEAPAGPAGAPGAGGGAPPPPPEVGVVVATPGDVGLVTELPGRLEASRVSQVRARAAGILQERLFREGSDVKAGQPLFRIDPGPYAAASQSAAASLARAEANAGLAKALAERYKPLVEANAVSKQEYANAVASQKAAEADVAVGRASVATARINLGYATVTAPISGRIGRALVTEGALVGQGDATQLAVIQQINPMYVNFTQSATEVLKLRRAMEGGQFKRAGNGDAASVRIVMEDGSTYAETGRLLFADLSVDPTSGQVTLRAEVPNPRGELLPGLYVRVRIEQAQVSNAITLPQQAVTRTQQGDTITVVAPDGKLAKRNVKISAAQNNQWIVLEGLKAGEQVMVDGFQKLQMMPPGTPVKAVPWKAPAAAGAAGAAGAGGSGSPAAGGTAATPAGPASAAQGGAPGLAPAAPASAATKS
ncbi:MAG: efflux RND transporter periplasmic adaptor subunit [Comamonadaceae bacterium]|nr:MAG: efflux RND transporter periplasmic adaptor subunit [Comamonadaceae bacterium]